MMQQLYNSSGVNVELNKWHLVYSIDSDRQESIYVRFIFAWDLEGNSLYNIPAGTAVIVELEYNGIHYP